MFQQLVICSPLGMIMHIHPHKSLVVKSMLKEENTGHMNYPVVLTQQPQIGLGISVIFSLTALAVGAWISVRNGSKSFKNCWSYLLEASPICHWFSRCQPQVNFHATLHCFLGVITFISFAMNSNFDYNATSIARILSSLILQLSNTHVLRQTCMSVHAWSILQHPNFLQLREQQLSGVFNTCSSSLILTL